MTTEIQQKPSVLKRYLVFGYDKYYPGGGHFDVIGDVDTIDEVNSICNTHHSSANTGWFEYIDVLDMQERRWLDASEYNGPTIEII